MKTLLQQELKKLGKLIRLHRKLKREQPSNIYIDGVIYGYKDSLWRLVEVYKKL